MNTLEICNSIRMEVEHAGDSDFPFDVFPPIVQKIILDAGKYDSINIEFLSTAMLSAVATAIGNAFRIHVRGNWYTNCALFFILVGRPGTMKTPSLSFAYFPIRDYDTDMSLRYRQEIENYHRAFKEGGKNVSIEKPHICQVVLDDYTPETLYQRHYNNQRGIVILVDEFMALIKSRKRYSSESKIIEDLLSAFSGSPINYTRKDEESHIVITYPCINVIGGIQTTLLQNIFTPEFMSNGFTDRLLFVAPENLKVPLWSMRVDSEFSNDYCQKWIDTINKILSIKCDYKENSPIILPKTLEMSDEARQLFYSWNNENAMLINSITDDELVDTRLMKLNGIVPRLALILQVLRWATGNSHIEHVDAISLRGALRLIDYYNKTYDRVKAIALTNETRDVNELWLDSLPDEFTTDQARAVWLHMGLKPRSLFNHLKLLCSKSSGVLTKDSIGHYHKNKKDNGGATQCI